jgi:rod shape-determining protein MreB
LIGERTAENVKIAIGSATKPREPMEAAIRGRDLLTGLPREVIVTDADIRESLAQSVQVLVDSTKEVLETTPPEILSDVMNRGIVLVGGGALIHGMPDILAQNLKIPVTTADDPLTAVARGTGIVIEHIDDFREVLIEHDNELPPR